jgi:hypothetical protein
MTGRKPLGALLVCGAMLLAGCGSTAHLPPGASGAEGLGLAGPGGGTTTAGTASAGTAGLAAGSVGSAAGGAGGTSSSGAGSLPGGSTGGGPTGGGSTGGGSGSRPVGVSARQIEIGIPYAYNGTQANQAAGANGITQGDEQGEAQALINQINASGGILGHKLVPVWFPENALTTETTDQIAQSECQEFEQDHHVFAIFDGGTQIIEQCAQQAGAVEVNDDLSFSVARTFATYPSYFEVSMMDLNRIVLNEAQALQAQSYFAAWNATLGQADTSPGAAAKVGIITYDDPDFQYAVNDVLVPELRRLGHAPSSADVIYVTEPQSNSDLGTLSAETSNAILKFRQDGVEHVLIVDATGLITLEFLNDAQSQHYYPRYGWSSQNGPEALESPGDVPAAQMTGSMGIGWIPALDLSSADNPDNGPYSNPARRACIALMTKDGYSFSDTNAESVALALCAQFAFLQAAIKAGGPVIDQAHFIAGADQLGGWSGAGDTFGNFIGSAQHDGAAYYRYYQWVPSCSCMRYTSGPKPAVGEGES